MRSGMVVAALIFSIALQSAASAETPSSYEGRLLFNSYCLLCHGPDGKGGGPLARKMEVEPADLTRTIRTRSDVALKKIISGEGRQFISGRDRHNIISDAMPEWKDVFSDEEIASLIAYLRFLNASKHPLMADPEKGHELYQKYCRACHGLDGEGDGVMTSLIDIEPMDHTNSLSMNEISNLEMIRVIKNGKGDYMPGWKDIISDEDVKALVSYIRLLSH
ncbi:MAG: c-type cytochrome [Myxococcota bacterium]|jgi:mono/diheme cytochrome c family protein|nr:c-type cytochrome [Myxococcota bacterium]